MSVKSLGSRPTGAAAIGFALLILTGNLVLVPAGMPAPGSSTAEAIDYFTGAGSTIGPVAAFVPAAWVLATVFGAGATAAALRSAGPDAAGWAYTGFAGILLQNLTFTAVIALRLAMAAVADPRDIAPLWALHEALFGLNGTFLALAMIGLGTAGYAGGLFGRGQLLAGLAAAALQFTSAALTPLVTNGYSGLGLFGLTGWLLWVGWLIGYGIALLRRPEKDPAHSRSGPAAGASPATSTSG